ncbi:MAG: acetyl-coenzyme A synthetase, partial [Planctomycetales bacterium]|nr:acetyl-coenzyme A synthetase [Planctomycetales bacterium]
MSQSAGGQIDTVMTETRLFPPSDEFASRARIGSMEAYQQLYDEAKSDPAAFWSKLAQEELHWFKPFETALEWNEPFAQWFVGGQTNASYNCLDAHLGTPR